MGTKNLIILISLLLSPAASGQEFLTFENHSRAGVISEYSWVPPGTTFWMALSIHPDEGWHSYWQNPGDSGAAPLLNIKSSVPGVEISPLRWPVPERIRSGPLTTFGFSGRTEIYWQVTVPASVKGQIEIAVDAEWLICKVECIPAFHLFEEIVNISESLRNTESTEYIFKAIRQIPGKTPLSFNAIDSGEAIILESGEEFSDFFPLDSKLKAGPPSVSDGQMKIEKNGDNPGLHYSGLMLYKNPPGDQPKGAYIAIQAEIPSQESGDFANLLWIILSAFLGGLILNLMPCVFPILALKIFGLSRLSGKNRRNLLLNCLSYQAGVSCFFMGLALLLWLMRQSGSMVGWGFQLQSPGFLYALSCFFILLGCIFLGLLPEFSLPSLFHKYKPEGGLSSEFASGALAVLVATPCTAPFMGVALGFAVQQTFGVMATVFFFMSLGFGFPFLIFPVFPRLADWLPKPGQWMIVFKEMLAFPLFATSVWLLWIYGRLTNMSSAALLLCVWLFWFFLLWYFRRIRGNKLPRFFFASGFLTMLVISSPLRGKFTDQGHQIDWKTFDAKFIDSLVSEGKRVFVNITADWCITCQVNDRVVFQNAKIIEKISASDITMIKGDWSHYDPAITSYLKIFGRASLPFYAWYPLDAGKPQILPELLTPAFLTDTLRLGKGD